MTVPDDDRPPGHFGPRNGDDQSAYGYGRPTAPAAVSRPVPTPGYLTHARFSPPPGADVTPNRDQPTIRDHSPVAAPRAERPTSRRGRPLLILGAVGVIAVLGTVALVVHLTRAPDRSPDLGPSIASRSPVEEPTTGTSVTPTDQEVTNGRSGLSYRVPGEWTAHPTQTMVADALRGITLRGMATRGAYSCESRNFVRGWAGSVRINRHRSPDQAATDFARAFTAEAYPAAGEAGTTATAPRTVTINGRSASRVDTTVTLSGGRCAAGAGRVITLVFEDKGDYQVFITGGDTEGGVTVPAPLPPRELEVIAASVRG